MGTATKKQMDTRALRWETDPGHGWLVVPMSEVRAAGVADMISTYSYIRTESGTPCAYLEEDQDALIYLNAAIAAKRNGLGRNPEDFGGVPFATQNGKPIPERHWPGDRCPIRSYADYPAADGWRERARDYLATIYQTA